MKVLAIETSTRPGTVAWVADGIVRATREVAPDDPAGGAGRRLAPTLYELLKELSASVAEVDLIAVGLGPGGYTGTRLAIATARGLGFAANRPVIGVVSTAAAAARPSLPSGRVIVAIDAKNDDVYVAEYRRERNEVIELKAPTVERASEVARSLDDDSILVGDGASRVLAKCDGRSPRLVVESITSRAEEVAALGAARFERGERDDETSLLPLYLRVSEAERRFLARQAENAAHPRGAIDSA